MSPAVPVQPEFYETGTLQPLLLSFSIRKLRDNQEGLILKGEHQVAVSAVDVNLLSENIKNEEGKTGDVYRGSYVSERKCVLWLVTTLQCKVMI